MQIGRRFGLSEQPGEGVYCSEIGVFVGGVPLLERLQDDPLKWRVRSVSEINHEVSRRYRLPVELNGKLSGLAAIAEALNRSDLLHAQIVALHLQAARPASIGQVSPCQRRDDRPRSAAKSQRPAESGLGPGQTSALAGRNS